MSRKPPHWAIDSKGGQGSHERDEARPEDLSVDKYLLRVEAAHDHRHLGSLQLGRILLAEKVLELLRGEPCRHYLLGERHGDAAIRSYRKPLVQLGVVGKLDVELVADPDPVSFSGWDEILASRSSA